MSKESGRKKINIVKLVVTSTMATMTVQLVQKAFSALANFGSIRQLRVVMRPYLWFYLVVNQCQLL